MALDTKRERGSTRDRRRAIRPRCCSVRRAAREHTFRRIFSAPDSSRGYGRLASSRAGLLWVDGHTRHTHRPDEQGSLRSLRAIDRIASVLSHGRGPGCSSPTPLRQRGCVRDMPSLSRTSRADMRVRTRGTSYAPCRWRGVRSPLRAASSRRIEDIFSSAVHVHADVSRSKPYSESPHVPWARRKRTGASTERTS